LSTSFAAQIQRAQHAAPLHARAFDLVALIAGCLLPFAFAPFGFYPLAIISPALLLLTWLHSTAKQTFWRGFLFGLGFFGIGASWVYISIHQFGNAPFPLAAFITILFVAILALFIAISGYIFTRFLPTNNWAKFYLAFPSIWVLFEWIRSWILTGFPWLLLATSQTDSPLSGFAPLFGTYGLAFIITLNSALLVSILLDARKKQIKKVAINISILIAIWLAGFGLSMLSWTATASKPIQVSLMQGNIPQQLKWDKTYLELTLKRYVDLTQQHWDSHLIIWPEAAIPLLQQNAQPFLNNLNQQAKKHRTTLITGIPIQEDDHYYNGMIAIGMDHAKYYKRHLVIFGEYLPWWINWLRGVIGLLDIPMSDFSSGSDNQAKFNVAGLTFAPFICYEIAYPDLVLKAAEQSQVLLTINNDAWFDDSIALAQHLQIGRFQALATGRYLLFLSNTGMTAIVTPQGRIQNEIPAFKTGVLTGYFKGMTGLTPWAKLGDKFIILLLIVFFIIARTTQNKKLFN